jgi:hypothetical protein
VADVATERLPDGSYAYEVVVVSVPRQTGKTTLIRAMGVHRAAVLGRHVYYTAQTGKDARARWADLKDAMVVSPVWGDRVHVVLRGGAECVHFHHKDGPGFHCFAPVEKCLHGSTPAVVVLDEAFAHDAAKGEMLMGAITPAQQTILARQLWLVSTMGTAESTFFHDWVERAREGSPRVALFLWGADDPAQPYSLEGIESYHPGVGFLLNERVLSAADVLGEVEKMTRSEYVRAFGNLRTQTTSNLIPADIWRELRDPDLQPPPDTRSITLTYDVALDRLSASIVATWQSDAGPVAGKVVRSGPGTSWLADAVQELVDAWRPGAVAAAGNGPVLDVSQQLRDRGVDVQELNEREFSTASGALLARVDDRLLVHDGGDVLEVSVTGLATRAGAVDGVAFSRRHSAGDASAGIALAVGLYVTERWINDRKPVMFFAS